MLFDNRGTLSRSTHSKRAKLASEQHLQNGEQKTTRTNKFVRVNLAVVTEDLQAIILIRTWGPRITGKRF